QAPRAAWAVPPRRAAPAEFGRTGARPGICYLLLWPQIPRPPECGKGRGMHYDKTYLKAEETADGSAVPVRKEPAAESEALYRPSGGACRGRRGGGPDGGGVVDWARRWAMTPEELANETVVARSQEPGGPWFVELRVAVDPPVLLGPYTNPAVARQDAAKVRR